MCRNLMLQLYVLRFLLLYWDLTSQRVFSRWIACVEREIKRKKEPECVQNSEQNEVK